MKVKSSEMGFTVPVEALKVTSYSPGRIACESVETNLKVPVLVFKVTAEARQFSLPSGPVIEMHW